MIQINAKASWLALCVALTSSLALSHQSVAADPGLSFYPAAGWNVETFDAGDGANICSISNEFNNGFIVQFTGTQRGMNDMSVDFRQAVFEENQSYNMAVNIPGYLDTADLGVAYNEQVVGFDLSAHGGLMNALNDAGVLDVHVEGNAFRFFLTGFTNAANRFENCLADAAPAPAMVSAAPSSVAEGFVYSSAEEAQALAAEAPVIDPQDLVQPPAFEGVSDEPVSLTSAGDVAADESYIVEQGYVDVVEQERYLVQELVNTGDDWRDEPELFTDGAPSELSVDESQYMIAVQPEVTTNPDPDMGAIKVTTSTATIEKDFSNIGMDASVTPLLVEKLTAAPVYNDEMQGKITNLEYAVEALKQDKAILEQEIETVQAESAEKRLSITSDNWNLEHATMKFRESERQVERMGRQLRRERTKHASEISRVEGMLFDPEVTNSRQISKLAELEDNLDNANGKLSDQQRRYEARIQILEKQLNTLSH